MAKEKKSYRCALCGAVLSKWSGQCPTCHEWNCLEEWEEPAVGANPASAQRLKSTRSVSDTKLKPLTRVGARTDDRIITGIAELDRVLGGGIVRDSVNILAAKPGCGKSTLLLQLAQKIALQGKNVLYVSGEESEGQIKRRAERVLPSISEKIWVMSSISFNEVMGAIEKTDPELVILDSIQTFVLDELTSRAGTPTQVTECTASVIELAKNPSRPRAFFMAGQLTKEDELAGVRSLEHMVDCVLFMENDDEAALRLLYASKNRFGPTGEMGFFSMGEEGLISIDNPSEYFITKREAGGIVGSALTCIREGSRPVVAEAEALCSSSCAPYPSRISESMKKDQLSTLISILESRGGINLFSTNVVVKSSGGLKLGQPSSNLAVIMAIASSALNKPIPVKTVFLGDVGLTGELKSVPAIEQLVSELDRMKFDQVIVPAYCMESAPFAKLVKSLKNITVIPTKTLKDCLKNVF